MKKILILAASNQTNMVLAKAFEKNINQQGGESEIIDLIGLNLPLYTPQEAEKEVPISLQKQVDRIRSADAMVFVAPEYNLGIPPVLTNFICWISVKSGDDWRSCFNAKPAAVATHSGGGGLHLLMSMKMQLSEMGMNVIGRQMHTHYKKPMNQESMDEIVKQLISNCS